MDINKALKDLIDRLYDCIKELHKIKNSIGVKKVSKKNKLIKQKASAVTEARSYPKKV